MATYDYTLGAATEFFHQWRSAVWVPLDVDVTAIIASDSTLTTNATIGAGDIIEIYDILGRRINKITENEMPAGDCQLTWNADDYSSGVYFYKLSIGNNVFTRKMSLLK